MTCEKLCNFIGALDLHERRDAKAEGIAEGEARGIITLLKRQGASVQEAVSMLGDMLQMDKETAEKTVKVYW